MILVTTDTVPGKEITACLGMILACVPFFGTKYGEGITNLNGVTTPDVSAVYEKRRSEAFERLAWGAEGMGANAVIAVRMDVREITSTWKEICAYGTAVVIET